MSCKVLLAFLTVFSVPCQMLSAPQATPSVASAPRHQEKNLRGLAGNVSDCCCSSVELEKVNNQTVHGLLKRVVATPFFGHFQIDLCSQCSLWQDHPQCVLRDCSVCECQDPPTWARAADCGSQQLDQHVTPVHTHAFGALGSFKQGSFSEVGSDVIVDLRENPERFTGYSGESAAKVWDEIHNRNCFQLADEGLEVCMSPAWQRVYNRLLSGLHSSISLHIAHDYCRQKSTTTMGECDIWGPNTTLARDRVLDHPDRVENLYATFAVLLRAVVKAGSAVSAAVPSQDASFAESLREWQTSLLPQLKELVNSCPKTFAENEFTSDTGMWDVVESRLKHLAKIMQCVGCDRCKLWGTLQTQGLSTALRVLFKPQGVQSLSRQDAVALVHTLERLSSSLQYIREFASLTPASQTI